MAADGVMVKENRSSTRLALQCAIIVANGVQTGEGQVLNLSKHGCLVESVVRWVQATLFGVEFLTIDEKHRSRLNQFIAMGNDPWKLAL